MDKLASPCPEGEIIAQTDTSFVPAAPPPGPAEMTLHNYEADWSKEQ